MINIFCDKLRYKVCDKKFCHRKQTQPALPACYLNFFRSNFIRAASIVLSRIFA